MDKALTQNAAAHRPTRVVVAAGVLHAGERSGEWVAAVFAADKVSKARELRVRGSRGGLHERDRTRIEHYEASLTMLGELIPGHALVEQLRLELEAVHALPAGGT